MEFELGRGECSVFGIKMAPVPKISVLSQKWVSPSAPVCAANSESHIPRFTNTSRHPDYQY